MRYIIGESLNEAVFLDESVISNIGNQIVNAGRGVKEKVMNEFRQCRTFNECVRTLAKYITMGIITISIAHNIIQQTFPQRSEEIIQRLDQEVNNPEQNNELHKKRVEEVSNLMKYVAELNGRSHLLDLDPENIVSMCEKYNFPLPLCLAQAHLESHFGTTPRAQRTNSVFSVGSYDNGKNICTYPSKDASVESYIKLMQKDYLGDKTVDTLLTPGNFVNPNGDRYSSNKNYEKDIRATMNGLIKRFCPSCFEQ